MKSSWSSGPMNDPTRKEATGHDPPLPWHVRSAVAYIRRNIANQISLNDLVQEAKVSERTLHRQFRRLFDMTPLNYLQALRLTRVREELMSGEPGEVSEIATRAGFRHFGRFSMEYKRRFGE